MIQITATTITGGYGNCFTSLFSEVSVKVDNKGVAVQLPQNNKTFVEIDHEIISIYHWNMFTSYYLTKKYTKSGGSSVAT